MRKWFRVMLDAFGVAGGLLGIGGYADNASQWAEWLKWLAPLGENLGRWLLVVAGVSLVVGVEIRARQKPRRLRLRLDDQLQIKKLSRRRAWSVRFRVYNQGPSDTFGAKACFVDEEDSSPSWKTRWVDRPEEFVRIDGDDKDSEHLEIAVVTEPKSVTDSWTVVGTKAGDQGTTQPRRLPVSGEVGLRFRLYSKSGEGSYTFGVRIGIEDQRPRAIRDDSLWDSAPSPALLDSDSRAGATHTKHTFRTVGRTREERPATRDPGATHTEVVDVTPQHRADVSQAPRRQNQAPLTQELRGLLKEGVELKRRIPERIGLASWTGKIVVPATEADVEQWESEVSVALHAKPREQAEFLAKGPPSVLELVHVGKNPLYERIAAKLDVLDEIIRRL